MPAVACPLQIAMSLAFAAWSTAHIVGSYTMLSSAFLDDVSFEGWHGAALGVGSGLFVLHLIALGQHRLPRIRWWGSASDAIEETRGQL